MGNSIIKVFAYSMAIIIVLGTIGLFICLASVPFWLLWNWLIPTIFGLPKITLFQAGGLWALLMLIRSTKFDWKETFGKTNDVIRKDNVEWDDVFVSIKKNYMA
tara:strand:+ start:1087 stop:1398 length:312 start_codon:yes stop_codon:yes gene_type:complete